MEGEETLEDGGAECESVGVYSCELCGVRTTNYPNLQSHLRGRGHMEMIERSEVAQRSVYVRGFPNVPTAEGDLRVVMGVFGEVVAVAVKATSTDIYALIEFRSAESALRALSHTSPLTLHTATLTVKPRLLTAGSLTSRRWCRPGRRRRVEVATPSNGAGLVERGEGLMIGGIRLSHEAMTAVSTGHSPDSQLEALALHCQLSKTVSEMQLALAWQLQNRLRVYMPSCMVIPFGAPFSGHGTVSSDCDLCVLSEPSPTEVAVFSGPAYLPTHLHTHWQKLQTVPPLSIIPTPQPQSCQSEMFDVVLTILKSDQNCSNILALRHARCPIIRFLYRPHQLHCDISFDNRLGPANTRLLAAYMNFDPRMAVLVPCVRLWARGQGLKRSHLNNYALSLMLIHYLQHTTPPVLPCLQQPGVWPKNMAWIGSRGFSVEKQLVMSGRDCSFTDPLSLLPSTNTASPAHLLLHFFQYYSEKFPFQGQVIGIHTLSPISPHHPTLSEGQSAGFKVSSICLQDPFDWSHNVTKNISSVQLQQLLLALKYSQLKLQELLGHSESDARENILSLFRQSDTRSLTATKPLCVLQFDITAATRLLQKTCYEPLAGRLHELDLSNPLTQKTLNCIILEEMTAKLEREFEFKVHSEQETAVLSTCSVCPPDTTVAPYSGHMRKRQRPPTDKVEEDVMEVEEGQMMVVEEEEEEEVKRQRLESQESAEQLLFRLTKDKVLRCHLMLTAMEETWVGRRRRKRQTSSSPRATDNDKTSTTPCLSFYVSVCPSHPQSHPQSTAKYITVLKLHITDLKFRSSLQQFFAVCKKWLLSGTR